MPELSQLFLFLPVWVWIVIMVIILLSFVVCRNLEFEGINLALGPATFRLKRRTKQQPARTMPQNPGGEPLQQVLFDYEDSPENHGWRVGLDPGASQPAFKHVEDGFIGRAIEIQSSTGYDMNFTLDESARDASQIEFIAKYISNSVVYAVIDIESRDGSARREATLTFLEGSGQPVPNGDGTREWEKFLLPVRHEGPWAVLKVDLKDVVKETFGRRGWVFKRLIALRVRGHTAIAKISVFR